jgi:hypothetical protein
MNEHRSIPAITGLGLAAGLLLGGWTAGWAQEVRFTASPNGPGFSFLSWDSEGNTQTKLNLLRSAADGVFQVRSGGTWVDGRQFVLPAKSADGSVALGSDGARELVWTVRTQDTGMIWSLENVGKGDGTIAGIRLTLPFNPVMAATSVLPAAWLPPDGFGLPAVLSAADFGQLLVQPRGSKDVKGYLTGRRRPGLIDVTFEIPAPAAGKTIDITFTPWRLPAPARVDQATWKSIRRGWWNVYGPMVHGEGISLDGMTFKAPAGVLSNNPISDSCSGLYGFFADHALLVPELAPGITAETTLRHSVNWWLDERTDPSGAVPGYSDKIYMLDAPAGLLVAACTCAELSGDLAWARTRIPQLEKIADFLASRDVDHDGIVESPVSGNANTLRGDRHGGTAWDVINSGHKELTINTLAYRAFCSMAQLEKRLGRPQQAQRYADLAAHLKKAFFPTFYNPETKLLTWWISADGQRHEYWAPGILGLPIAYGLVPRKEADDILSLVHAKVRETGFTRLDLGLPCLLTPIRRADYHLTCGPQYGAPSREDGTDTFQRYLNGSCMVNDQVHWLNAHFRLGRAEDVRPQLAAMVARQGTPVFPNGGSFQNGIINKPPLGAEFFDWSGKPCGYEGHLTFSWFFLQAALTQHPQHLEKILRPMAATP